MKLHVYTDFVRPTAKVESLRVLTEKKSNNRLIRDLKPRPYQRKKLLTRIPFLEQAEKFIYIHNEPFIPRSRLVDVKVLKQHRENAAVVKRVFEKEKSVFKYWMKDTPKTLEETACLDIKQWKVRRFVKDEEDYNKVEDMIINNFEKIKHIFTVIISSPDFPNIGQMTMGNFCEEAGLLDKSNLVLSDIDRCFIAANLEDLTGQTGQAIS